MVIVDIKTIKIFVVTIDYDSGLFDQRIVRSIDEDAINIIC